MAYPSLADFLEELASLGQLSRVAAQVALDGELAAVTARVARSGGPALVFERVGEQPRSVVTNLLGTADRVARAVGVESPEQLEDHGQAWYAPREEEGWFSALWRGTPSAGRQAVRAVRSAGCQQIVHLGRDVALETWPLARSWPEEPRASLVAQVLTADAVAGVRHLGRSVLEVLDERHLAWHISPHEAAFRDWQVSRARCEPLPIVAWLGGDPAGVVAAASGHVPAQQEVDGLAWLAHLRRAAVDVVACRTTPLEVPADAEVVIEGVVHPVSTSGADSLAAPPGPSAAAETHQRDAALRAVQRGPESPLPATALVGPLGYYRRRPAAAVVEVTAITHRSNPLVPLTITGPPPHEDSHLQAAAMRLSLPALRRVLPQLVAIEVPSFAGARLVAFTSIRKRQPLEGRRVAGAIWSMWPWASIKWLVVVDDDVDPTDPLAVWARVAAVADPARDFIVQTVPADPWDPTSADGVAAPAVAIDATFKLAGEREEPTPARAVPQAAIDELLASRWSEYGLG